MEKYFDALLYLANWGSHHLMFRLLKKAFAGREWAPFCAGDSPRVWSSGEHVILSLRADELKTDWEEGEGWMDELLPIRADLLRGDLRALYLGWLRAVQNDDLDDEQPEPPLPPGLRTLSEPLDSLTRFSRPRQRSARRGRRNQRGPGGFRSTKRRSVAVDLLPARRGRRRLRRDEVRGLTTELRRANKFSWSRGPSPVWAVNAAPLAAQSAAIRTCKTASVQPATATSTKRNGSRNLGIFINHYRQHRPTEGQIQADRIFNTRSSVAPAPSSGTPSETY